MIVVNSGGSNYSSVSNIGATIARASGAAGSAEINLRVKEAGKSWRVRRHYDVTTALSLDRKQQGLVLGAGARLSIRVTDNVSDNLTNANAQLDYEFIDV